MLSLFIEYIVYWTFWWRSLLRVADWCANNASCDPFVPCALSNWWLFGIALTLSIFKLFEFSYIVEVNTWRGSLLLELNLFLLLCPKNPLVLLRFIFLLSLLFTFFLLQLFLDFWISQLLIQLFNSLLLFLILHSTLFILNSIR